MKTLNLKKYANSLPLVAITAVLLTVLVWWLLKHITLTIIDPSIIQVILIAFAAWIALLQLTLVIAENLFKKFLAHLQNIFNPYRKLTSWQQHVLYLAFLALLALSGTGCLIAIC